MGSWDGAINGSCARNCRCCLLRFKLICENIIHIRRTGEANDDRERASLLWCRRRRGMTTSQPTVGVSSTFPADMPADHAAIPVWNAENWFYEDWPVGQKIRSLRRTIAEGDSHLFNALVLDIHPYVQDQMFAETRRHFRQAAGRRRLRLLGRARACRHQLRQRLFLWLRQAALHQAGLHRRHHLHDPHQPR